MRRVLTGESLGQRIARLRRAREWSQRELADHAKLGRSFLARIETDVQEPTLTTLQRIANAVDLDVSELVADLRSQGGEEDMRKRTRKGGFKRDSKTRHDLTMRETVAAIAVRERELKRLRAHLAKLKVK
jgi:transcriptional regulator with XRE-family HTH domain